MTDEEEIELTPCQDSPWYKFMHETISCDIGAGKLNGWHWFWCLYYAKHRFKNFDLATIQNTLPDGHWIKKINDSDIASNENEYKDDIYPMVATLFEKIGKPEIISTIDFSEILFDNDIDFSNFIFPVEVDFSNTVFSKEASFIDAIFIETASFNNAKFHEETFFGKALFFYVGNFDATSFFSNVDFSGAIFSQIAGFRGTKFFSLSEFSNTTFAGHTTFAGTKFNTYVPHFYNAKISPDTIWERDISNWPQLNKYKHNLEQEVIDVILCVNQNAYENLAYNMKTAEKYHDEHFFFRQEMRCRRKLGNFFNSLIYGFYEYLADYGYGVGRAFSWWLVHIIIGSLALFGFRFFYGINDFINDAGCALGVSLANSHGFFFMGDRLDNCYGVFKDLPFFTAIWATQTVFGIALLFLLLLTLRTRFRLK